MLNKYWWKNFYVYYQYIDRKIKWTPVDAESKCKIKMTIDTQSDKYPGFLTRTNHSIAIHN